MFLRLSLFAALLATSGCVNAVAQPKGVRISERFGYDPVDSTKFLQSALNSGERVLIVDRQKGDWISRPLRLVARENLTIAFEDGVRVVAKRGEFKRPADALLTFDCCTNISILGASPERCGFRMWHDDYYTRDKSKPNSHGYRWSEWRHGLSFLSCSGVTLERISSNESGGDGLYISTSGRSGSAPACRDVVIRNCIFDRNNRQGISVIGVDGFLCEDTLLSNTFGTAPGSGIDFEPNHAREPISNVVMRRCRAINNEGRGYEFFFGPYDGTSRAPDALFEDCEAISNKSAFVFCGGLETARPDEPVSHGNIVVKGCRFSYSSESGIVFTHRPYSTGEFKVCDTLVENNCIARPGLRDISLSIDGHGVYEPSSYRFENVTVIRPQAGRVFSIPKRKKPFDGRPDHIGGAIRAIVAGQESLLRFDDAWNAENLPYAESKVAPAPRVAIDLSKATVVDKCPGKMVDVKCPPFFRARARNAVFYADSAREVHFRFQQTLVGKRTYRAATRPIVITRIGEKKPVDDKGVMMPADPKGGLVSIRVPEKGFYRIALETGGNGVAILATDVPLAFDTSREYVNFIAPCAGPLGRLRTQKSELFVHVTEGTDFTVFHSGAEETVGLEIVDPTGKVVRHEDALSGLNMLTFRNPIGGLWTIKSFRPTEGSFEDYNYAVSGVPGWLFLTPDKYWK